MVGNIDLYNIHTNEIKTIFREYDIFRTKMLYVGGIIYVYDTLPNGQDNTLKSPTKYDIIDIIEFCDRNTQIVYGYRDIIRDQKLNELLNQ